MHKCWLYSKYISYQNKSLHTRQITIYRYNTFKKNQSQYCNSLHLNFVKLWRVLFSNFKILKKNKEKFAYILGGLTQERAIISLNFISDVTIKLKFWRIFISHLNHFSKTFVLQVHLVFFFTLFYLQFFYYIV